MLEPEKILCLSWGKAGTLRVSNEANEVLAWNETILFYEIYEGLFYRWTFEYGHP